MSTHIGVEVAEQRLRAAFVQRARTTIVDRERSSDGIAADLGSLLESLPRTRWPLSRRLTVALGRQHVQTKHLAGIPPVKRDRDLQALIGHGVARFFVGDASQLIVVAKRQGDHVIAEAFDRAAIDDVLAVSAAAGARAVRIVSAATLAGEVAIITDCAVAATALAWRHPLAVRRALKSEARVPRWRAFAAAAALCFGLGALVSAPFLAEARTVRRANAELLALRSVARPATQLLAELSRTTALLGEVTRFQNTAASPVNLLAALSYELPDDAALVAFALDTAGGSLVALAAHGMDVVALLDSMPSIREPRLNGVISRERSADRDLERVSLKFSLQRVR